MPVSTRNPHGLPGRCPLRGAKSATLSPTVTLRSLHGIHGNSEPYH